jgi:hypothetical protein
VPKRFLKLVGRLLLMFGVSAAHAQETPEDPVDKAILSVFQKSRANVLCLTSDSSLPVIRKDIETLLRKQGIENPSATNVAKAAYTLFPCPFSPYREELRPATAKDIEGVWLYPEASQKLRFGPQSPMRAKLAATPIRCEAVAYYPGGEARNAQVTSRMACPFAKTRDMNLSRATPRVASWKMIREGTVAISRTDVQDHVEEWEIFLVTKSFEFVGVKFDTGDLLAYLRRERGNDVNAATVFRHLQRLP